MRRLFSFILILLFVFMFGCGTAKNQSAADKKQQKKTEKIMSEISRQIGMPAIKNFQEKKFAKMIFELRDKENLICYAYIVAKYSGRLVFLGKCIGYGLPYSVQYTNPMKIADSGCNWGYAILPQADPNGLYMTSGLSATWIMLIDKRNGKPRPVYIEPEIIVSPFRLH